MMNVLEANVSFWQNASLDESQFQWTEFPHWRLFLSLLIVGYWLLSVLPTAVMSSTVLLAMKSNSLNKSLAVIHTYTLSMNILVRVCSAVAISAYIPSMIRFCICSTAASSISFYLHIYNVCYQPFAVASLALFQLLIIKGRKTLVNHKTVGMSLILITMLAIIIALLFTIVRLIDGDTFVYDGVCPGPTSSHLLLLFASYAAVVWMPSLLTAVVVTIWSCAIFKHNYAGRDSKLNRRIISVPLIVPAIITLTTTSTFGLFQAANRIPTLSTDSFIRNWAVSVKVMALLINEITGGLSYPCLILFLNPKILRSWKRMCCFASWIHNQVEPSQTISNSISGATSHKIC